MSVYKRGDIWWVKFQVNGQTIRRSAQTEKKREAETFERKLRDRIESDIKSEMLGKSLKRTCGEALVKWIEQGAPESMYSHIRCVRPYVENVLLTKAVPAAAEMKASMLAEGLNPQTVNRRLAVIRRIVNLAYSEWEWLKEPLGQRISAQMMSEKEYARHIYLTTADFCELCSHIDNFDVVQLLVGYASTGLRETELLSLTPEQYQRQQVILDAKTKGKRPRIIPIPSHAQWVFESLPFKAGYDQLRYWFEKARLACGRPDWRIHDLRHSFASWLIQDPNIPLTVVRDILGHSNLSVTSRYSHLRTGDLKKATSALPELKVNRGHKSGHNGG